MLGRINENSELRLKFHEPFKINFNSKTSIKTGCYYVIVITKLKNNLNIFKNQLNKSKKISKKIKINKVYQFI